MKDDELIKLLQRKPDDGIKILTEQYAGLVYAVVMGKLNPLGFSSADIEECVADTFSEFYFDIDKFSSLSGSIKSFLCVIARNNAIDLVRKRKNENNYISLDDETVFEQFMDEFSIEENYECENLRQELMTAIKNLGEPDCEIIIRKFYLYQSSKQIAEKLDMTVSNVDTRTHRAIKKLKEIFGGDCK